MRPRKSTFILLALTLLACEESLLEPSPEAQLEQITADAERFRDIDVARSAGYTVWSPDPAAPNVTCASSPEGRMGYHLVNPTLRGSPADSANADAVLDYMRPEMLLYEKRADGTLDLVGVEYLIFKAAWERVHGAGAAPPEVLGQVVPLSIHAFPPAVTHNVEHYELHAWLWKANPNGMFSHWNPNVSC